MVKFLLSRPIAVSMVFIAFMVMGIVASNLLPVSLMPDVDIPKITINVSVKNTSAREIENTIVKQIRQSLMQVSKLADIKNETRDGTSNIKLDFEYGTNIDLAFIEVNEMIDRAMADLPKDLPRPKVIKASATDIPAFYLNLTLKNTTRNVQQTLPSSDFYPVSPAFEELSLFTHQIIQKRIEQLPQVALADISGCTYPEILIIPDMQKLHAFGISVSTISSVLEQNNINIGNLLIRDGQYEYNVRMGNHLSNKDDIKNVYLNVNERIIQLKDIATIIQHPQKRKGKVVSDGKDAISIAVIKQSDAKMGDLEERLKELIVYFKTDYPHIEFTVTRDQTKLLDYSIRNLKQSLLISAILAFLVMFFFLKEFRSPLLIGITIPTSLLISLFFFHLIGISINIISLSGLILGIGMMIDNSIIVIDNINQYRTKGVSLTQSCIIGTNEVFRPMLSSVLTTCAVFMPLIFINGIAGALFYDQAIAVTIGLLVSLIVSITLLPVYYNLIYGKGKQKNDIRILSKIKILNYEHLYESGLKFILRRQYLAWILIFIMIVGTVLLFNNLKKERFPQIVQTDTLLKIDWNEQINIDENNNRLQKLIKYLENDLIRNTCYIGEQDFLLDYNATKSGSEALIYFETGSTENLEILHHKVTRYMSKTYNRAIYSFESVGNIFNLLFSDNKQSLEIRLRATKELGNESNNNLQNIVNSVQQTITTANIKPIAWQEQIVIKIETDLLMLYDISYDDVYTVLKRNFSDYNVLIITENQNFLPVIFGSKPKLINEILNSISVENKQGKLIALRTLFTTVETFDLNEIIAGKEGEYYPVAFDATKKEIPHIIKKVNEILQNEENFEASYFGSYFSNRSLINELAIILGISLLLLYFILASQFESLVLPLIVLLEVPIDIFGSFLLLKIFGSSINLMSMIGIVVMSGIIINDSILKIDTINKLMANGNGLLRSLMVAGKRRLKPILMTSITTILALFPFIFMNGLGADMQKPLAYSIIGGMIVGTFISLYFIPLCYFYLTTFSVNNNNNNNNRNK